MKNYIQSTFLIAAGLFVLATLFKLLHLQGADIVLLASFIASAAFILLAIWDLAHLKHLPLAKRILWMAFLFFAPMGPIIYFLMGPKSKP